MLAGTLSVLNKAAAQGIIPDEIEQAAVKGDVQLKHLPILLFEYAKNALEWAGAIAIIMVMVGGVQYILGGLTDNKEQGKKTIMYSITGVVMILLSWFIVDFFYQLLT